MAAFGAISATLVSIQVGTPKSYGRETASDPNDLPWTTSFFKSVVNGPVFTRFTNLDGDRQADLESHGGADKAVLAYSADHYPKWREELGIADMPYGAFGENLTIAGLGEESVCIGDRYRIGAATFEVSQPRQPCWKLARRWRMHKLTGIVVANGRTGWYFRVLEEGLIEAGMSVSLLERSNPEWAVARANQIIHHRKNDLALTLELAAVPRLSKAWARGLSERAAHLRATTLSA
ncbi:MAG TPA: MOSC domain-containing protein [Candidatus Acidoferrales bacterium]|nr:MOSC domain-containing protein [Candidatus Acidoferrales bacterium]